jgi:glutathione-regulated potassium-efflux system ancillary protein KefG
VSSRVLVLFAHPALHKSRVHRRLVAVAERTAGVTLHDLYEAYPDFDIDVPREQELLLAHDVIVLQHPFYWYSTPAILKQWEDLVLEHGWAYGSRGTMLQGKRVMSAITVGGREAAYGAEGHNRRTVQEFLYPIEQTVRLCRMDYLPPFLVLGTHLMTAPDIERAAAAYGRVLAGLRDGTLDLEAARRLGRVEAGIDATTAA